MAGDGTGSSKTFLERVLEHPDAREVEALRERLTATQITTNYVETALDDDMYDDPDMAAILLTSLNGDQAIKEQTVEVEYLKRDQKLVIPTGLGMNPLTGGVGMAAVNPILVERYWKASRIDFNSVLELVNKQSPPEDIRKYVDTLSANPRATRTVNWPGTVGPNADQRTAAMVYAQLSNALQFNFDVRDMGILNEPGMRASDTDWKHLDQYDHTRLTSRMKGHTLMQVAALNTPQCKGAEIGGWVRAYGLSCGLLPDTNSQTVVEYVWSTKKANKEVLRKNTTFEKGCSRDIKGLCLNIISMFGLFHLAKDHTYREGDLNMERIGTSWLNTLQLVCDRDMHDYLLANREVVSRTASHPFGLAQTYFCAKLMNKCHGLSLSLALRVSSTPPPVQRVMICDAAIRGWATLPAGSALNGVYKQYVKLINDGVLMVKDNPPAYSGLYKLYGETAQAKLPDEIKAAAEALAPVVAGYAEAVYGADKNEGQAKGLALALSLTNIKREFSAIVTMWTTMWNKYMDVMDRQGIMQFAAEVQYNTAALSGAGAGGLA